MSKEFTDSLGLKTEKAPGFPEVNNKTEGDTRGLPDGKVEALEPTADPEGEENKAGAKPITTVPVLTIPLSTIWGFFKNLFTTSGGK